MMNIAPETVSKTSSDAERITEGVQESVAGVPVAQIRPSPPAHDAPRRSTAFMLPRPLAPGHLGIPAVKPLPQPRRWTYSPSPSNPGRAEAAPLISLRLMPAAGSTAQNIRPLYRQVQESSTTEAFTMGLVVAAALTGIAYGLLCSFNLASNWDLFSAGIQRLIQ